MWLTKKLLYWVHSYAIQNQGMKKDRETQEDPASAANFVGNQRFGVFVVSWDPPIRSRGRSQQAWSSLKQRPSAVRVDQNLLGLLDHSSLGPTPKDPNSVSLGQGPTNSWAQVWGRS